MEPVSVEANVSKSRMSMSEVVVLVVLFCGSVAILLPALPASREAARSNICQNNLRRIADATHRVIQLRQRLPQVDTWPTELRNTVPGEFGDERVTRGRRRDYHESPCLLYLPRP